MTALTFVILIRVEVGGTLTQAAACKHNIPALMALVVAGAIGAKAFIIAVDTLVVLVAKFERVLAIAQEAQCAPVFVSVLHVGVALSALIAALPFDVGFAFALAARFEAGGLPSCEARYNTSEINIAWYHSHCEWMKEVGRRKKQKINAECSPKVAGDSVLLTVRICWYNTPPMVPLLLQSQATQPLSLRPRP